MPQASNSIDAKPAQSAGLILAASLLTVTFLAFDFWVELGVAAGVTYVALVCLSYLGPSRRWIWLAAGVGIVLTLFGYLMSSAGGEPWKVATNRGLAILAIVVTALFVDLAKRQQLLLRGRGAELQRLVAERTSQLEESEARMKLVFESSPCAKIVFDGRRKIMMVNSQVERIYGYSKEEMLGQSVELLLPAEVDADDVASEGNPDKMDLRVANKQGRTVPVDVRLKPVEFGDETCTLAAIVDISDRKQNEAELARRAMEAELLHQVTTLGAESESFDDCLQQCVKGICELTQWPVGHAYVTNHLPPAEAFMEPTTIWSLADESKYRSFVELTMNKPFARGVGLPGRILESGKAAWIVDVQADHNYPRAEQAADIKVRGGFGFPIVVQGETVAVLEFFADDPAEPDHDLLALVDLIGIQLGRVVERQRLQSSLLDHLEALENSNQELEQFAYVASHDLQEPLRKISAYAAILLEECGEQINEEGHRFIGIITDGSERLKTLVSDLLSYSRITSRGGELTPVDAQSCLDAAIDILEYSIKENDATITFNSLPKVVGDESQLILLFQNLLSNALKYRSDTPPEIHVDYVDRGPHYEFSVRDNGIGIEPRYFDRIFEIFKRLHGKQEYTGTGIGLAICKRIVDRFEGRIWVASHFGQGSTFHFTLNKAAS